MKIFHFTLIYLVFQGFMLSSANAEINATYGAPGHPRSESDETVWVSECMGKNEIAISGICTAGMPGIGLQNFGPNGKDFECVWLAPMKKAGVKAICVKGTIK